MRVLHTSHIYNALKQMIEESCLYSDEGTRSLLEDARLRETESSSARFALDVICKNLQCARDSRLPVCQDTGMAVVFADIGQEVFLQGEFIGDAVNRAVRDAYRENHFRMSVAHPLTRINTGDNTPAVLHTSIVPGDKLSLHFMAKGFGSENMSALYMLKPSGGVDAVIESVTDCVRRAGANPCPPLVVGVGIGGTSDKAAELAKRALLRDTGLKNSDKALAQAEAAMLEKINALNIGAQGMGGSCTALAVHIECFATHIAGLPVAVNLQCHCVRVRHKVL